MPDKRNPYEKDGITVHVMPEQVWEFCQKNAAKLNESMVEIASNSDSDISIYLTDELGLPKIIVACNGEEIDSERIISKIDCLETVKYIYDFYLDPDSFDDDIDLEEASKIVEEREDELYDAVLNFLDVAVGQEFIDDFNHSKEDITEEILDDILYLLSNRYGYSAYRPSIEEHEDGTYIFEEYPYDAVKGKNAPIHGETN